MADYATIRATGAYLPPNEITNAQLKQDLLKFYPNPEMAAAISDALDKFEISTGITRRFWSADDQCTSDIALPACKQALERAGKKPEDVDLIILGTDSPDAITPATSTNLQHKLGAENAGSFDVGCACASFPTVLQAGMALMSSNEYLKTILCVGAYGMHKLTHPHDPFRFIVGDGAGAAVLGRSNKPGFISGVFKADGSFWDRQGIFAGGTLEPASEKALKEGRLRCTSPGRYPPDINFETWPKLVRTVAERGHFNLKDIDLIIFTQVRKPTIVDVMKVLELPMDKTFTIMEEQGYTGSACVPMALDAAIQAGHAQPGSDALVVLMASGVGGNFATCAFRMG